jgi:hypothetical protein
MNRLSTVLFAIALAACSPTAPPPPTLVLVTLQLPAGTSLADADRAALLAIDIARGLPGIRIIQAVARAGTVDVHILLAADNALNRVLIRFGDSPLAATAEIFASTPPGTMPALTSMQVPAVRMIVDPERAAAFGVTPAEVAAAIPAGMEHTPDAPAAVIKMVDGNPVRVGDVARFEEQSAPDFNVHRWP